MKKFTPTDDDDDDDDDDDTDDADADGRQVMAKAHMVKPCELNKGIGKPMCIRRSRDMIQHGTYFTRSCDIIQDQKWNKTIATRDKKTRIQHQNKKPHNKVIGNTDPEQK